MLTNRKIEIFQHYNGDGDGFARGATQEEKAVVNYQDWALIDSLIQDVSLIESGLDSEQYRSMVINKLSSKGIEYNTLCTLIRSIRKV